MTAPALGTARVLGKPRCGTFAVNRGLYALTSALLCIVLNAAAQTPVDQKQADREAIRGHCAAHFTGAQPLAYATLHVIYGTVELEEQTCASAADRLTSD